MGIGNFAFMHSGLVSVVFEPGPLNIGAEAFRGCARLASIVLGDGLASVGEAAFAGCTGLAAVSIPEGTLILGGPWRSGSAAQQTWCCQW